MRTLVIRLALTCVAIYAADRWVDGVSLTPNWGWFDLVAIGLVFGLLNALVKPILLVIAIPALIVTLGLFYFVVNGLVLWMTAGVSSVLEVAGFWAALKGSIVVSAVNWVLSWLFDLD